MNAVAEYFDRKCVACFWDAIFKLLRRWKNASIRIVTMQKNSKIYLVHRVKDLK
jgi:hypothetical protein